MNLKYLIRIPIKHLIRILIKALYLYTQINLKFLIIILIKPDGVNFEKYDHPSHASIKTNEDVLESILSHFNYDVNTHCNYPEKINKKRTRKRLDKKKLATTEGINENLESGAKELETNENKSETKQKSSSKKWKGDGFLDEDDEKSKPSSFGEKKSYEFETNVIQKNIREREAFAKAIEIAKLYEHFEKEQQLMDVSATENDNDEDSMEI